MKVRRYIFCGGLLVLSSFFTSAARGHNMPALDFYREKAQQRMHSVPCMSAKDFFDRVQGNVVMGNKVEAAAESRYWAEQQDLMQLVVDGMRHVQNHEHAKALLITAIEQHYPDNAYARAQFFVDMYKELAGLGITLPGQGGEQQVASIIRSGTTTKLLDAQLLQQFFHASYVLLLGNKL